MLYGSIWAIAPPVWFFVERQVWGTKENEKKMEIAQSHARDVWLGLGAIILFLADKRFDK